MKNVGILMKIFTFKLQRFRYSDDMCMLFN